MHDVVTIREFVWDDWNTAHIFRHDVTREEVEEVCQSDVLVQQGHSGRIVLIGPTLAARMIEVVLAPEGRPGAYYIVTAHPASKKDRALYAVEKGRERNEP